MQERIISSQQTIKKVGQKYKTVGAVLLFLWIPTLLIVGVPILASALGCNINIISGVSEPCLLFGNNITSFVENMSWILFLSQLTGVGILFAIVILGTPFFLIYFFYRRSKDDSLSMRTKRFNKILTRTAAILILLGIIAIGGNIWHKWYLYNQPLKTAKEQAPANLIKFVNDLKKTTQPINNTQNITFFDNTLSLNYPNNFNAHTTPYDNDIYFSEANIKFYFNEKTQEFIQVTPTDHKYPLDKLVASDGMTRDKKWPISVDISVRPIANMSSHISPNQNNEMLDIDTENGKYGKLVTINDIPAYVTLHIGSFFGDYRTVDFIINKDTEQYIRVRFKQIRDNEYEQSLDTIFINIVKSFTVNKKNLSAQDAQKIIEFTSYDNQKKRKVYTYVCNIMPNNNFARDIHKAYFAYTKNANFSITQQHLTIAREKLINRLNFVTNNKTLLDASDELINALSIKITRIDTILSNKQFSNTSDISKFAGFYDTDEMREVNCSKK